MNPAVILLKQLAAARREGVPFDGAWPSALATALAVVPGAAERREWSIVLSGMSSTWAEAFERVPASRRDRALSLLAENGDREPAPERECERWHGEIPDGREARAFYCSDKCRRDASYERTHAAA